LENRNQWRQVGKYGYYMLYNRCNSEGVEGVEGVERMRKGGNVVVIVFMRPNRTGSEKSLINGWPETRRRPQLSNYEIYYTS
jgi:hypothetical protein